MFWLKTEGLLQLWLPHFPNLQFFFLFRFLFLSILFLIVLIQERGTLVTAIIFSIKCITLILKIYVRCVFRTLSNIMIGVDSFSTNTKFSEKLTFFTSDTYTCVFGSGCMQCCFFGKTLIRTK